MSDDLTRAHYRYWLPIATRWGDNDMLGHVNNVQFLRYFETARLDYLRQVLGFSPGAATGDSVILADIRVTFLGQVHHPCALEVGTRISRLGNSSFDFEAAIFAPGDDAAWSTASATCVWFNFRDNHSTPIPPDARQTIQQFEGIES